MSESVFEDAINGEAHLPLCNCCHSNQYISTFSKKSEHYLVEEKFMKNVQE